MTPVPAGPYLPTNAVVAVAWLRQRVAGLPSDIVATALPRDLTKWVDLGFVQASIIPGAPDIDVRIRRPLVQVDAWAHGADSVKPPVGKANRLAELVMRATEDDVQVYGRPLDLGPNYLPVRVLSAVPQSEPAEVPGDPSGFARVTFDLALDWARI